MRGNIGKGTEEFKFFGDLFRLVGDYYQPEKNEEYWEKLIADSENLIRQYEKCHFSFLVRGFVLVLNVWLSDVKFNQVDNGHWVITFERGDKVG